MKLFLKILSTLIATIIFVVASLFVWRHTSEAENTRSDAPNDAVTWGVDFSASQAEYLGLDPKETYEAIIHDLGAKHIKLHINWNAVEGSKDSYYFNDVDWQVSEAEKNGVELIMVVGMKTGRWPECHSPSWTGNLSADDQKAEAIQYVSDMVNRYKDSKAIKYWQIENEPMIKFGKCPGWYYADDHELLKAEVAKVKSIDPSRKIIVSDSGELSSWTEVAKIGDIVGITMYRNSWKPGLSTFGINPYAFLAPEVYKGKAALIQKMFGKEVICIELQAEPWASKPLAEASLADQAKSMNPEMFAENIEFAKQSGLKGFYFWGVEWWYAMKTKHNQPEIWNQAKELFGE